MEAQPAAAPGIARRRLAHVPHLRAIATAGGVLLALVLLFHLAGGWYFATELNDRALSAEARREALIPKYNTDVLAAGGGTVTLRDPGSEKLTRSGTFGITWDGGWGILSGEAKQQPDGSVVRQFEHGGGSELQPGMRAALDSRVYPGDPLTGLGIPFETVTYRGELGEYPAWFIPGERATWFIFVHGNGMTQRDGLRVLPAVVEAGLPALVITYRGDDGAPRAPDDRLTYGKGEWRDLEAAVQYALDHGAESVVLEGMSMGGAVTMAFLLESPLASEVRGVVFDAPMLDFERAVEYQAKDESLPLIGLPLPGTLVDSAEWIASVRYGVDWGYADYMDRTGELSAPIFLVHGTADDDISVEASADFARARPDLVRDFYRAPGAGHVEAWNVDPGEYERRLLAFLAGVGAIE